MITEESLRQFGVLIHEVRNVSSDEALALLSDGAVILDVRPLFESEYRRFDVKDVIYAPAEGYEYWVKNLPFDRCLIVADASGLKSRTIASRLLADGFRMVVNLSGGLVDWERRGAPVIVDKSKQLMGSCLCQLKPFYYKKRRE
ncbi:MAG TPA: rhodanese-like domain-containing protein [Bacteroidales bacterium]|jgi:rhodanese-related sulfurtransferase|nr:rhodanese-like domain-containing protein [Bacteroidales bacterium]MDI9573383.1 rhodanese-like domain-containing protein [Bacteroidota bacterium]OQC60282.1 MAG: molybdopterin biosynthesis protein MoeB [Bacteroidetes bacterium ADurb.Bin012]MBP9512663.1 rhodanese-like domain-containing protein [Bacteroidales bacterium]MBP9587646.1 rhodanese-like domain-containing protein [Bacteroidales bacterium]